MPNDKDFHLIIDFKKSEKPAPEEIRLPQSDHDFIQLAAVIEEFVKSISEYAQPYIENEHIIKILQITTPALARYMLMYNTRVKIWQNKYPRLRGEAFCVNPNNNSLMIIKQNRENLVGDDNAPQPA